MTGNTMVFRQVTDSPPSCNIAGRMAQNVGVSRRFPHDAQQHLDQRCLASAVGTQQPIDVPSGYLQ